ncbi:MAG: cell wall hydrolase [Roseburia sp.]|nr:cell wall hydrolase [Roseburia sp.]
MKLNKKVIESMTVVSTMVVMSTFTALTGSTEESVTVAQTSIVVLEQTGTAGIIAELHKMEADAFAKDSFVTASIEKAERNLVAEGNAKESEETEEKSTENLGETAGISQAVYSAMEMKDVEEQLERAAEVSEDAEAVAEVAEVQPEAEEKAEDQEEVLPEENTEIAGEVQPEENKEDTAASEEAKTEEEKPEAENAEWADQVMANVEEDMNIRTAPDETSDLAGKFYRGDVAEIVEVGDEWTEITSGNVTGFVKNDYLVYGDEAFQLANEVCSVYATVNTDGLRLRSEPNEEAGIITTASNGDRLKVDKEAEEVEGWVAVKTSDSTAYVSADYVDVALNLGTALNAEEVKQKEAEKAAAEAKKAGKKPAMSASTDEVTLLGALIQCEAGNGSYEGMLAVGSVVMNRVRSGGYPGTISGVIYQAGQFPPALSGSVANVAAGGVRSACLQAAQEAINGADNTNGALQFRSASSGYGGTVIGGNVFF